MARTRSRDSAFTPVSEEQQRLSDAIDAHDVVFAIGPAGTGKTHVAASKAAQWARKGSGKIVITRPAIGGGEDLGFLPGDIDEKIDPFLKPILEIIGEIEQCDDALKQRAQRGQLVEKVAFQYLRGRTFGASFIVADEMQNATREQIKMVLTRLGVGSKIVITGDPEQCDLHPTQSGLADAVKRLEGVDGIAVVRLTTELSNCRHALVRDIVERYRNDAS